MMLRFTKLRLRISILFVFFILSIQFSKAEEPKPTSVDLVFCLDLSGSTNGLINDLRDNLWIIINQTKLIKSNTDLRIGVVGFSRPSFGKNNSYVKVLVDLTNHFDHLSSELYRLKPSIEKGDQHVNAALSSCISQLSWTKHHESKKIIFIIGNGNVTTNGVEYVNTCELAASRNIIINPVYIPSGANIIRELPAWKRIATITGGIQQEISVNKKDNEIVWPDAKFDRVREINNKLNGSYRWSGLDSSICRKSQITADSGAFFATKDAFYNRVYFKLSNEYITSISNCELTYAYSAKKLANIPAKNDSARQIVDEFRNRLMSIRNDRQKLIDALQKELPSENQTIMKGKYDTEEMPNQDILLRVVINTLRKQL